MKKMSKSKIRIAATVSMALMVILAFAGLAIGIANASGPTYVSGIISSDTTWTAADSPYIVTGNILVEEGVNLTIEPGVVVKFNPEKALQIDGELIAKGTETETIVFTSNQPSPAPGDWVDILFNVSSVDASYDEEGNYINGSIMQYCIVEYGGRGSSVIEITSSSPFIDHCIIKNNTYRGISVEEGSPRIYSNAIENNSASAIYAHSQSVYSPPTVIIRGNTINRNLASGICTCGISAILSGNTITNNSGEDGGGIHNCPSVGSTVIISNNTITGNSANNRGGGIYNSQYYGETVIDSNTISGNFANNEGGGIWTSYGWEGKTAISYNEVSGNVVGSITGSGIEIVGGQPTINYNNIYNNMPYDVRNRLPWDAPSVDATNNWWGTTDEATIQAHIYDWYDDASLGIVDYIPYLTEPVTPENIPPIASFSYAPESPIINQTVTFDASASYDLDGTLVKYEWDFGDGNSATGEIVTHSYASAGNYIVTVTLLFNP